MAETTGPRSARRDVVDPGRKVGVKHRQATNVVGGDGDIYSVVDIEPLGMMIGLFGHNRHARHERKRLAEVRELQ